MLERVSKDYRKSKTKVVYDVDFSRIPREKGRAFAKLRPTYNFPLEIPELFIQSYFNRDV